MATVDARTCLVRVLLLQPTYWYSAVVDSVSIRLLDITRVYTQIRSLLALDQVLEYMILYNLIGLKVHAHMTVHPKYAHHGKLLLQA